MLRMFGRFAAVYLKSHIRIICAAGLTVLAFGIVFYLYSLPLAAVLYAALLSLCACFIFMLYDILHTLKRHRQLRDLACRISCGLDGLPEPQGLLEQDYQQLLSVLFEAMAEMHSEADLRRTETIDYYTLWAHQIKTPIAAMRLLLQADDTPQNQALGMELFRIEQYVEMVLQYLRLESPSSDLVLRAYPLNEIIKQALRKYSIFFLRSRITLHFREPDCSVITDEKWLVFVIEQILSNAVKYTKDGTISIYMDANAERTLVIEDTGIGIRAEDLPRVFEKGYTGFNGRMDKKSTGIGLYLCKRILTKLSHDITITSAPGRGTKVSVNLVSTPHTDFE